MCGLVGEAGNLAFKDEATMQRLLLFDFFRGQESTGLAAVRANEDVKIAKLSSHPLDLFQLPKFKEALNGAQSKVFIGHNRAATRGAVTSYNAHPFQYGHIIGAHNGTLESSSTRALEEALDEKFAVDSMAIFAGFEKLGVEATMALLEEGRDSQTGAWALTWYDQSDKSINFLRNKHRPLWYAHDEDHSRLFWASEWQMIEGAVQMSVAGYTLYRNEKGHRFFPFDENVHFKWKVEDFLANEKKKLVKPTCRKIKRKEPKPVATSGGGANPFGRNGSSESGMTPLHTVGTPTTPSTTTSRSSPRLGIDPQPKFVHMVGDSAAPTAGYLSKSRFMLIAKDGCSFCEKPIQWGDLGVTVFDRDDMITCSECSPHSCGSGEAVRILVDEPRMKALM